MSACAPSHASGSWLAITSMPAMLLKISSHGRLPESISALTDDQLASASIARASGAKRYMTALSTSSTAGSHALRVLRYLRCASAVSGASNALQVDSVALSTASGSASTSAPAASTAVASVVACSSAAAVSSPTDFSLRMA
eukprot:6415127-Prymnesium_polylepis.1